MAYWPLNEVSGTTANELVNGSNGVYGGGCTLTTGGAVGAGFGSPHRITTYNGVTAYTQVPRPIGSTKTASDGTSKVWP